MRCWDALLGCVVGEHPLFGRYLISLVFSSLAAFWRGKGGGGSGFGAEYTYKEDRVVVADNLITSRGPALAIVEALVGREKRDEIEPPLILASGSVGGIRESSPDQVLPLS